MTAAAFGCFLARRTPDHSIATVTTPFTVLMPAQLLGKSALPSIALPVRIPAQVEIASAVWPETSAAVAHAGSRPSARRGGPEPTNTAIHRIMATRNTPRGARLSAAMARGVGCAF